MGAPSACDECGFVYDLEMASAVPSLAEAHAEEFADLMAGDPATLRTRSAPAVWSPLEYACHVRDVLLVQRERVLAARRADTPFAEPMGRDERVEHDGYARQRPSDVAHQVRTAAQLFGNVLDLLSPADWERTLVYTYPRRAERPLSWVAVHTLHELRHHLLDVRRQLRAAAPTGASTGTDADAPTGSDAGVHGASGR
ncbi:DinB family protein [Streptomyces sp. NPDC005012]|uniref:DinB family protein n=1 Tax=unclassified Streptomyces TaxID=2593676 RepID=UPI0033AE381B